ncbi:MAG: class I SAM-dependent methyltransferase [Ruminococcaceae bacterium]|nr:class I SAM-dependent methyltransferase [Oscillospiraceae bacterium]
MALSLIKENISYTEEGNIFHFIPDDESRPQWSKALDSYLAGNHIDLQMKRRYAEQQEIMTKDVKRKRFVDFVSAVKGVKVDLASGPSGYFSPFFDTLASKDTFIITDACPSVVAAHSAACNKENVYVFDMDLDQVLPFKDESIDIFTGNLLNNVDNYASLISEVYRCLRPGGKFAVIELFFDHGCKTYEHLNAQGSIWASFETFVSYCESVGFTNLGSEIINTRKGKISDGDLYPLDDNDCSTDRIIYFIRK